MAGIKWECRGFMSQAPKSPRKAGWLPFTIKWGGKQNTGLKGGK